MGGATHLGGWVPRVTLYCSGQGTDLYRGSGYSLIFDLYTVFSPAGQADLSPPVAKASLRSWVRFAGGSMRQGASPTVHEGAP